MKKLAVISVILLLLAGLTACQAKATPTPLPSTPTAAATDTPVPSLPTVVPTYIVIPALNSLNSPPLLTFKMFPPTDGWGLVTNQLLLTHNGGQNWFSVPLPGGKVDQNTLALFVDAQTLYVLLPAADGLTGVMYSSQNGGGTWLTTPVPFAHGQLAFIDGVGYFMETIQTGSDSMISNVFRSNDNGLTWNKILLGSGLPETGLKTGFSFISSEIGWVGVAAQKQKLVLYKTSDGAHTWLIDDIPVPQNISTLMTNTLPPVFFARDNRNGLLPVDFIAQETGDKNRIFYATKDGGATWNPGASVVDGGAYSFVDPQNGWVWGKHGLYTTNNAAQTWQLLPVAFGPSEQASMLSFTDTKTGWIVTTDAKNRLRIYNTRDGGNTWIAINP